MLTLPVLQTLREQWPAGHIEIWGYPHIAEVAVAGGLAQAVTSLERAEMARFFVPLPQFSAEQVAAVRSFDLVFNYLHDPVGQVRSNLLLAGAKQVLSGSPLIKRGHAVAFLLEPLQALALYDAGRVPELNLSAAWRAKGSECLRKMGLQGRPVAVHPGSGSPAKNWPVQRFAEIIRRLRRHGESVVLVLGEADRVQADYFAEAMPELPKWQGLTLTELAAALSASRLFLGNDSGITHMAAALGLPVVALFGPSNPDTWAPRGKGDIRVIQAPEGELERLEVSTVWKTICLE
jgi:heptosyltransferase-2